MVKGYSEFYRAGFTIMPWVIKRCAFTTFLRKGVSFELGSIRAR
jgi:hypothetical protein